MKNLSASLATTVSAALLAISSVALAVPAQAATAPVGPATARYVHCSGAYPGGTYQSGSRGPYVTTIQCKLNALLVARLATDGIYGQKTAAVVIQFQRQQGLSADGKVGSSTGPRIDSRYATYVCNNGGPC